ncbi:hypothetical protein A5481_27345 [Methylobacterium platani]|uniref:Transposase n=1 Tax=Methylobacterium platani TaxID=427683 RepID=A0A179RZE6_9HYPH|nr:hypothetical protein A5481_27345 [Methylobacterium platani]
MRWVLMSERELRRVEVLQAVQAGRQTVTSAAEALGISRRQAQRLAKAYRSDGAAGLRHKGRGRRSNRALSAALRELAMSLVRERYADFGPTLAAEMLREHHQLAVSRETLRGWMSAAGLWLSRRQRRSVHQPRLRREGLGELVQIDGSEHRWFEDRAAPCTLLVFIDDATGRLMQLRFVASESAFSDFAALEDRPAALPWRQPIMTTGRESDMVTGPHPRGLVLRAAVRGSRRRGRPASAARARARAGPRPPASRPRIPPGAAVLRGDGIGIRLS